MFTFVLECVVAISMIGSMNLLAGLPDCYEQPKLRLRWARTGKIGWAIRLTPPTDRPARPSALPYLHGGVSFWTKAVTEDFPTLPLSLSSPLQSIRSALHEVHTKSRGRHKHAHASGMGWCS